MIRLKALWNEVFARRGKNIEAMLRTETSNFISTGGVAYTDRPIGPGTHTEPTGVPDDDSELSPKEKADREGWQYIGFGRYVDKNGKMVARIIGNKLLVL